MLPDPLAWIEFLPMPTRTAWIRSLVLLLMLGLATYIIVPRIGKMESSLGILGRMNAWMVGVAVLCQAMSYWGSGYMLRAIARLNGKRNSIVQGIALTLVGNSAGMVAGGQVGYATATYYWATRMGIGREGAVLMGWLPSFFNGGVLTALAIAGTVALLVFHSLPHAMLFGLEVGLVITLLIAFAIPLALRNRQRWVSLGEKWSCLWAKIRRHAPDANDPPRFIKDFFHAYDNLREKGWHGPLGGAILNFGFDMLTLFFLFLATGHIIRPGVLLACYGLPLFLGRLSFLPGGVGVVEASMTALFVGLGTHVDLAVGVVLAYRLLSFWFPVILGFLVMLVLQGSLRSQASTKPVEV